MPSLAGSHSVSTSSAGWSSSTHSRRHRGLQATCHLNESSWDLPSWPETTGKHRNFYQADMSNPSSSTQVARRTHPLNAIALQLHAAYLMPGAHRRLPHTGTSLAHCRLLVAADPHRRPWNLDTSHWHLVLQHWSLNTHCLPLAA